MTKYLFEGQEVTAGRFDPWDQMFLIDDVPGSVQPQWVEVDDDRLTIVVDVTRVTLIAQIVSTLGDHADDYDVTGIADVITGRYGAVSVDSVDSSAYWTIVAAHDLVTSVSAPTIVTSGK